MKYFYQVRKGFHNPKDPNGDYNYYVLSPNHYIYNYDFKSEKDVLRVIDLFLEHNPNQKNNIWYTKIIEEDIYIDDLKNDKMNV